MSPRELRVQKSSETFSLATAMLGVNPQIRQKLH